MFESLCPKVDCAKLPDPKPVTQSLPSKDIIEYTCYIDFIVAMATKLACPPHKRC